MSSFSAKTTTPQAAALDPTKHVNYTLGMVLGVDDFTQEFAYLSGRDQWLARDLLGYGTVCGLRVAIETDVNGPQVVVSSGAALSPHGRLIRVDPAQCARLNEWLAANKQELVRRLSSPPGSGMNLSVVLCYRECPTDNVPIPGEPCRSEEEAMAPSRLADDFELELRFDPPDQREEDALRDFMDWLREVEITNASTTTLKDFLAAVRSAAHGVTSPPDFMYGSPPAALDIPADRACEYLRAAFRIWVTELRPMWLGKNQSCGTPPDEACLLLAELQVPLLQTAPGEWKVDDDPNNPVIINEARRPYLIHLRMLQELLLCGRAQALNASDTVTAETTFGLAANAGTSLEYSRADHTHGTPPNPIPGHVADLNAHTLSGDVTGPISNTSVEKIRNVEVEATAPTTDQVLTFQGGKWKPSTPTTGVTDHGALTGLNDDDHPQYLLANGTRALTGNLSVGNNKITNLAPATAAGDAVPFQQAIKTGDAAGGDLDGTYPNPIVDGLQNRPVSNVAPNLNEVLTWDGASWTPRLAAGDFVEHPPGLPRYFIVAAGIVKGDGTNRPPVYNQLVAAAAADSLLSVSFNGYQIPDGSFQYIIKVLPLFNDNLSALIVSFDQFQPGNFILRVTNAGAIIRTNQLAGLEFMIEVSRYEQR